MTERRRGSVSYDDVTIDVIQDVPDGPATAALVLLPSSSRDSEDFDEIAVMFADVRSALHGIAGALRRGDSASRPHAASRAGGHSFVASAVPDPGDATLPFVSFETTLLS